MSTLVTVDTPETAQRLIDRLEVLEAERLAAQKDPRELLRH